jgi:hypothetical protein
MVTTKIGDAGVGVLAGGGSAGHDALSLAKDCADPASETWPLQHGACDNKTARQGIPDESSDAAVQF